MIFNPNKIIELGAIKGSYRIEPNAFDFTADKLHIIDLNMFYYSNDKSNVIHRTRAETPLTKSEDLQRLFGSSDGKKPKPDGHSGWVLIPGRSYDVTSNVYVEIPEGAAAFLVGRSTGNRNGIIITSGLYDSGYKGHIGCVLHNYTGHTYLEKGTFIGQIIFMDSDNAKLYAGGYNNEQGQHWTEVVNTPEPTVIPSTPEPIVAEPIISEPIISEPIVAEPVITKDDLTRAVRARRPK